MTQWYSFSINEWLSFKNAKHNTTACESESKAKQNWLSGGGPGLRHSALQKWGEIINEQPYLIQRVLIKLVFNNIEGSNSVHNSVHSHLLLLTEDLGQRKQGMHKEYRIQLSQPYSNNHRTPRFSAIALSLPYLCRSARHDTQAASHILRPPWHYSILQ